MRRRWKTFVAAFIIIAFAIGLQYAYVMYLRPKLGIERQQVNYEENEEQSSLILKLIGQNYFAEFGNPNAPTKVVGYITNDAPHNQPTQMLVETARQFPDDLYVKLLLMGSPPAVQTLKQEGKKICARYEINGQTSFELRRPDGSTARLLFEESPSPGAWTTEDLKMAVEQAIANTGQSVAQNRASTPGLPAQTGKVETSQDGTTPAPQQPEGQSLLIQLLGDKPSGEWGEPAAPTKVVAYLPEACRGHESCIQFLIGTAQKNPSQLHLRIVRMFTTEGQEITMKERGKVCAAYVIDGNSALTITLPGGRTEQVTFETSPETGAFTTEQLKMAVQQAMAKHASTG